MTNTSSTDRGQVNTSHQDPVPSIFDDGPQNPAFPRTEAPPPTDSVEPIAVIGLSAKFPQDATSPEAFWQMLVNGNSALSEIPESRFRWQSFYSKDPHKIGTVNTIFDILMFPKCIC